MLHPDIVIAASAIDGKGLFATKFIPDGVGQPQQFLERERRDDRRLYRVERKHKDESGHDRPHCRLVRRPTRARCHGPRETQREPVVHVSPQCQRSGNDCDHELS